MSRVELAKECRLTGAAITIIVKELLESGKIIENGQRLQRNHQGRKEVLLDLNYNEYLACNINIERDNIHFSLCSLKGIVFKSIKPTKEMMGIEYLRINIERITRGYEHRLVGIGIGVTGAVDEQSGELVNSYGLFPNGLNIKEELGRYFQVPIYVANNVRAQAMAIISMDNRNFLYIKHGPGVGCAIVINGKVLNGHTNKAGEMSQVRISCASDKLEDYLKEDELLAKTHFSTTKELYAAYRVNKQATEVLDECILTMAYCVINMNKLIDPEKIILGGGFFYSQLIYEELYKKLCEIDSEAAEKVELLSEEVNIKSIASARLVFNKVFFEA
jgi:predicted NBD/HSP70 family sugar kinase